MAMLLCAFTTLLCTETGVAHASVVTIPGAYIIHDGFSGTSGSSISARTPDQANLPGQTWNTTTSWGGGVLDTYLAQTVGRNQTDETSRISIASNGPYTKPTDFYISARFTTIAGGNDNSGRGATIGFSDTVPGAGGGLTALYGVTVRGTDGFLTLNNNGTAVQTLSYVGLWDNTQFHTLSYRVSTTTGSISEFTLDNLAYAFSGSFFNNTNTQYAIFTASSNVGGFFPTYVDDFAIQTVVTVPEPSTLALVGLALCGVAIKRRRGV